MKPKYRQTSEQKIPRRFRVDTEHFKKFTLWERIKIALGYNLKLSIDTAMDKRDGRCWQKVVPSLTKAVTAAGQIRENIQAKEEM